MADNNRDGVVCSHMVPHKKIYSRRALIYPGHFAIYGYPGISGTKKLSRLHLFLGLLVIPPLRNTDS